MDTNEKVPLVVFSGGADSTYMLLLALQKGDVWTVYIDGAQGKEKSTAEMAARKKIFAELKKLKEAGNIPGVVLEDYVVDVGHTTGRVSYGKYKDSSFWSPQYCHSTRRTKFNQPLQWLFGVNLVINPLKVSEIQFGYITGDQMTNHLHDLSTCWDSLMNITHVESVPLAFPLKYHNKKKIVSELWRELLDLVWVCEPTDGKGNQCLKCDKCWEFGVYYSAHHGENPPRDITPEPTEDESEPQASIGLLAISEPGDQPALERIEAVSDAG